MTTVIPAEITCEGERGLQRRLGWFVLGLAGLTWLLMGLGSATRVMNAGLACPDWPLCYGTLWPNMNLEIFLEWFHRLVAATVGSMTLVLLGTSWIYRRLVPGWLPWAAGGLVALVGIQGLLGGLTVTELLRFDIVTAHLGTGLLFFLGLLTVGYGLLRGSWGRGCWFSGVAWGAAAVIYLQSLLGALVASRWAVHQCLSGVEATLCQVLNSHLLGVVPATLAVLLTLGLGIWQRRHPLLLTLVGLLLVGQLALGWGTFSLRLQVEPLTVAHQMVGAALLGSLVVLGLMARHGQLYEAEHG
ncbi:MAG: COX15/CtaA family protein [Thermostichales cyanobacterium SZTDM-1c_bins_54]